MTDLTLLADSLAGTFPGCDDGPLAIALLRALAQGDPVTPTALAAASDQGVAHVNAALSRWPNVQRDTVGRVVAFSGLSLLPTAHRFDVGEQSLYTWCAWDTLFLPAMLEQTARVRSRCPATGTSIALTVAPYAVQSPPEALHVSFPPMASACCEDITATFCCHVHFLAGHDAADRWSAEHDVIVLAINDAFELGRLATRACYRPG